MFYRKSHELLNQKIGKNRRNGLSNPRMHPSNEKPSFFFQFIPPPLPLGNFAVVVGQLPLDPGRIGCCCCFSVHSMHMGLLAENIYSMKIPKPLFYHWCPVDFVCRHHLIVGRIFWARGNGIDVPGNGAE